MSILLANNFSTSLSAGIDDTTTTIPVSSVTGLPAIGGGDSCYITIQEGATIEILLATSVAALNITATRAQQGTSASAFTTAAIVQIRATRDNFTPESIISGKALTSATVARDDKILAQDTSASDALKSLTAESIAELVNGHTTTATAAGTTTLTVSSTRTQVFTGITTQTVPLPVVSTLLIGSTFTIVNLSSGVVTVQSSGANTIQAMQANSTLVVVSNATSGTGAAVWTVVSYSPAASGQTGSGSLVRATSPSLITPALGTPSALVLTNATGLPFRGFSVSRTTAQSVASLTSTKIQLNVEAFDTEGDFDAVTNFRHTPTLAGKWLYVYLVSFQSLPDGARVRPELFLNGSVNRLALMYSGNAGGMGLACATVVDMNGTTDYVELYGEHSDTVSRNTHIQAGLTPFLSGTFLGV